MSIPAIASTPFYAPSETIKELFEEYQGKIIPDLEKIKIEKERDEICRELKERINNVGKKGDILKRIL